MKIKNSKFIKFFVVGLVCVFGFFGFNCVVNADSINDTPDYQYLKMSYYNWDNITWYTDNTTYVTGSNDTFSTETEFVDYYSINIPTPIPSVPTDLTGYTVTVPSGWTVTPGYGRFSLIGYANWIREYSMQGFGVGVNKAWSDSSTNCAITTNFSSPDNTNTYSRRNSDDILLIITGGNDVKNPDLIQWFVDNGAMFELTQNTRAISSSDYSFLIERNNVYNDSLSDIDLFVYDSLLITDLKFNSIVFEKSNFFMKVVDLNSLSVPMISSSVLSGGYNITFEINGFVRDINGDVRDLSIVTNERIDVLGYQTLFPTFQELFGNVGSINNDSMMYINNIRVLVEFPNNYVDNLSYRYSVSSIESNNIKYGGAFNSWVNSSINTNLGSSLVDNINTFLQIEILPGLSFFGILLLAVAVPMLIWILKIFFGG